MPKKHTMYCKVCGEKFEFNNMTAFLSKTMKRHREEQHAEYEGSISYSPIPQPRKGPPDG